MPLVTRHLAFRIAAILGFLGVALGAFGAHGLQKKLELLGHTDHWNTAVLYHLVHAVVLTLISRSEPFSRIAWCLFASGILLFSGSLYILSVTDIKTLAAVTPFGGLALLGGWLALVLQREGK